MKLLHVGFYRELPHGEPDGPSLLEAVSDSPAEGEELLVRYLEQGIAYVVCAGVVEDVIDPSRGIIGAPHALTDGVWAWPADLAYYVREYHARLPAEFWRHIEERDWTIPPEDAVDLHALED